MSGTQLTATGLESARSVLESKLRLAFEFHQRGSLAESEQLCRDILRTAPDHARALHLLGLIALQAHHSEEGIKLIRRSLALDPNDAFAHSNLGAALRDQNRPVEALASCERALHLRPDLRVALCNRGNALRALGRHDEAVESYRRALRIDPQDPTTLTDLGKALNDLDRCEEAMEAYRKALRIRPKDAVALTNLGISQLQREHAEEALLSFEQALEHAPNELSALLNRGTALLALKRPLEALRAFESAERVAPNHATVLSGKASALTDLERLPEALVPAALAVRLEPQRPSLWINLANLQLKLQDYQGALTSLDRASSGGKADRASLRLWLPGSEVVEFGSLAAEIELLRGFALQRLRFSEQAIEHYRAAIQLEPRATVAWSNLAGLLFEQQEYVEAGHSFEQLYRLSPEFSFAAGSLAFARHLLLDWRADTPTPQALLHGVLQGKRTVLPFLLLSFSDGGEGQLSCARTYMSQEASAMGRLCPDTPYGHERLRVGYLSGDLRDHAVAYLISGVIEQHDRKGFEPYALSLRPPDQSRYGQRIASSVTEFLDLSRSSDAQAASLIRAREIDILIDLSGYTQGSRSAILAHRPAPLQVNYLGFPATMGAPYIDYLIADEYLIPEASRLHYAEQIVYLPECFQANDDRRAFPTTTSRAQLGLPEEGLILCCFNNSYKINPTIFSIWMRLLQRHEHCYLWLVAGSDLVQQNLRREASARAVAPQRLLFAPRVPYEQHLARLGAADLFLDTLPFNGGTTVSDALWAGLPVLSCSGEALASRMAGSLLRTVALSELIACDLSDYERRADQLIGSPAELSGLRARLLASRHSSPLFNTERFTRHLEQALIAMHENFRSQRPTQHLFIPPLP